MWLSVDRIEGEIVVLLNDEERIFDLPVDTYQTLTAQVPRESDMLWADVDDDGHILTARIDDEETARRQAAARARLDRLFGRRP